MATSSLISGFLILWLSVLVSETAMVKIHRTGPRSVITQTDNESWCGFELCKHLPDISKVFAKKEAWLYSIPATILVGMAGVLPLLVISVEAGHSLREGGRIKLNLISCLRQPEPSINFSSHIVKRSVVMDFYQVVHRSLIFILSRTFQNKATACPCIV